MTVRADAFHPSSKRKWINFMQSFDTHPRKLSHRSRIRLQNINCVSQVTVEEIVRADAWLYDLDWGDLAEYCYNYCSAMDYIEDTARRRATDEYSWYKDQVESELNSGYYYLKQNSSHADIGELNLTENEQERNLQ
eukprot:TRINITY_DN10939_c0_g1_i1.p3 TRINITY_DN10939_c0_g1~~TRINITY_DN10939_c0_g1_i1.p3  ORF type:complete len:159 (-),score=10.34 TRINITY_DN10939_c0_g1_i1:1106-1513(-)